MMKLRKTTEVDVIISEVILACEEEMIETLHKIFSLVRKCKHRDWSRMIINLTSKNGDKFNPENCRAVALLSIPGKLFARVLLNRIRNLSERILNETRYGFRQRRRTIDVIFRVKQIMKKDKERKVPLYYHFRDFKSVFDILWRKALWRTMKAIDITRTIVGIIEFMYDKTDCTEL